MESQKLGRNDPCPCGSGKKYKKCCIGKPGDPAGRSGIEAPSSSPAPFVDYAHELHESLDEILRAGTGVIRRRGEDCVDELCRALGLDAARVERTVGSRLPALYSYLGSELLTPAQERVRQSVGRQLYYHESRALYRQLLRTPLKLWNVQLGPGWTSARAELGPCSNVLERVSAALSIGQNVAGAWLAGWILTYGGQRFFVCMSQLQGDGIGRVLRASQRVSAASDDEFWGALAGDMLRALVDPSGRMTTRAPSQTKVTPAGPEDFIQRYYGQMVHEQVATQIAEAWHRPIRISVKRRDRREIRWFREEVARAVTAEQRQRLIETARLVLEAALRNASRPELSFDLMTQCDVGLVLAPFGVREDGSLAHLDEDVLVRRPAALLALADDHPIWADLHSSVPVRSVLAWARDRSNTTRASSVEKAYALYLAEERWLATFRPIAAEKMQLRFGPTLAVVLHALLELFHPDVPDAPLNTIELGSGGFVRLCHAIERVRGESRRRDEWRVRDLPQNASALLHGPGYGQITHARLLTGLLAHAETWRARRAGLDPAAIDRQEAPSPAREALREGLEELASLFEPS
ncbi:MAG: SEC-C metal-binding domain-containing protein [Acidobacteriota bacterium]